MIPFLYNSPITQVPEAPTRTYHLHLAEDVEYFIAGHVDGLEAMRQAVFLRVCIERYKSLIFDWNYGIETEDLFGMPTDYCVAELPRRVREALSGDNRILSVSAFKFTFPKKGVVCCSFTVYTIYGDLAMEREVQVA